MHRLQEWRLGPLSVHGRVPPTQSRAVPGSRDRPLPHPAPGQHLPYGTGDAWLGRVLHTAWELGPLGLSAVGLWLTCGAAPAPRQHMVPCRAMLHSRDAIAAIQVPGSGGKSHCPPVPHASQGALSWVPRGSNPHSCSQWLQSIKNKTRKKKPCTHQLWQWQSRASEGSLQSMG